MLLTYATLVDVGLIGVPQGQSPPAFRQAAETGPELE
jgi:hypothetical protein